MKYFLSLSDFRKQYPLGFSLEIKDLNLPSGIHLILGENGSGKSTLLRALAGIHSAEGEILLEGISLSSDPLAYRMLVGFAEAEPLFPSFLSLDDLIQVVASSKKAPINQIEELKVILGIGDYSSNPIGSYSSGMLKKSALLLAFLGTPKLVILDEPFTTLDRESQERLTQLILDLSETGISFLLTSHQSEPLNHLPIRIRLRLIDGTLISHE